MPRYLLGSNNVLGNPVELTQKGVSNAVRVDILGNTGSSCVILEVPAELPSDEPLAIVAQEQSGAFAIHLPPKG